jgi:hypothetical protein
MARRGVLKLKEGVKSLVILLQNGALAIPRI